MFAPKHRNFDLVSDLEICSSAKQKKNVALDPEPRRLAVKAIEAGTDWRTRLGYSEWKCQGPLCEP